LVSDTQSFQSSERNTITEKNSGKETGPNTERLDHRNKTAPSLSPTTGRVLSSAPSLGNAEEPDSVKEVDGAPDMTVAKELPSQTRLQASSQITE
jgi:hypothetical protein